jgi:hypothetical protein
MAALFLAMGAHAQTGVHVPPPATAETATPDTLPIEISLLHSKLLKELPVYEFLLAANPIYRDSNLSFAQMTLMDQERNKLKSLYENMALDMLIHTTLDVDVTGFDAEKQTVTLKTVNTQEPIIFDLFGRVQYGVFIRNAADLVVLAPPYETLDSNAMDIVDARKFMARAKVTLRPVAADATDFLLEDETPVKVILADIVEIKIPNRYSGALALHKTFLNYRPSVGDGTATLFSPELLESISKKKPIQ